MIGVRRALAFSLAERYLLLAIGLASNMAIARLLTPQAIGIYSVSMAIIGIAQVLRDFGVASYLIQERDLSDEHIGTAFGFLLVLGISVFTVLFFGAPWIARFYGEVAMVPTLRVCAANFLLLPFCTVSLALLRRAMAFRRLAVVNFLAGAAGAAVSVLLAFLDFGVISLALGSLVVNAVTGVVAWLAPENRRHVMPGFSQWRSVLGFGAQSSVAGVITSVSMDVNDLAVGKIMGFEPVAILSRAQGLMNLFHRDLMSAVRNVAYPAYAQAARDDRPLEPLYVASVSNVTVLAWPFYGFVALYSLPVLRLLFGSQWDAAAPLVPVFCLAGALAATSSLIASLILAVGRVDLVTKVELAFQPFRAALVVVAALIFKTTMACAVALAVSLAISIPLLYWVKGRCLPNDHQSLLARLWSSAKVTVLSLVIPCALAISPLGLDSGLPGWLTLGLAGGSCVLGWLTALFWLKHPLSADPAMRPVANLLFRRRKIH